MNLAGTMTLKIVWLQVGYFFKYFYYANTMHK